MIRNWGFATDQMYRLFWLEISHNSMFHHQPGHKKASPQGSLAFSILNLNKSKHYTKI